METILIVDDDKDLQFNLSSILKDEGYGVKVCGNGKNAIKEVKMRTPNVVLLDMRLPAMDGMKVLGEMKKFDKDLVVIMLTAYGDIKNAVKAMKLGAFDYITKPFDNEELFLIIKRALETRHLTKEVEHLRKKLYEKKTKETEKIMGEGPAIQRVLKQVEIVAPTNLTVIIQGESGTGKELISNLIHQKSLRKDKPFIPIDCGAIPETLAESELFGYEKGAFTGADSQKEGKFEQANTGTIFLDEIANLSDGMQAKLLRVIQERRLQHLGGKKDIKIDVRLIIASKTNLMEAVKLGKFRDDLFHRLNEFCIELPKLCERKEDIPILAGDILDEVNGEFGKKVRGFSSEAMKFLLNYSWPGNVRELKNVIKKAVLVAGSSEVLPENLPTELLRQHREEQVLIKDLHNDNESVKDTLKDVERGIIEKVLFEAKGNKVKAAKLLSMSRKTLYRKLKSFGM